MSEGNACIESKKYERENVKYKVQVTKKSKELKTIKESRD